MNNQKPSKKQTTIRPSETKQPAYKQQKFFNPFEGRDSEEVWKEIRKNGTSISHQEMMEELKKAQRGAAQQQARKNKSASD